MKLNLDGFPLDGVQAAIECILVANFKQTVSLASLKADNARLQAELGEVKTRLTEYAGKGFLYDQLKELAEKITVLNEVADPCLPFWDNPTGIKKLFAEVFEGLSCEHVSKEEFGQRVSSLMANLE